MADVPLTIRRFLRDHSPASIDEIAAGLRRHYGLTVESFEVAGRLRVLEALGQAERVAGDDDRWSRPGVSAE